MPHPDFEWAQTDDTLEIRVPLTVLGANINPSSLSVEVKEKDIIVVTHQDRVALQQRVHDDVTLENWSVENSKELVMEFAKNDAESWPCLLRLPMKPDDRRLLTGDGLDALLRTEMARLPRDEALENERGGDASIEVKAADDFDFDDVLDDALDELAAKKRDAAAAEAAEDADGDDEPSDDKAKERQEKAIEHELRMTKEEFDEFEKLRAEMQEKLEADDTAEDEKEKIKERLVLLQKMVDVSKRVRRLRSKRPAMSNILEILRLEIYKGRLNHGASEEEETEAFANDEERNMTSDALMKKGVEFLETDLEQAMHFIRLAAIHHNHPVSTCLLQRLYNQMRVLAKAAYFVFRRARLDDVEPSTNLIVGEFVDKGMPLFPPYMALAVYFYQRAATVGSTHAMLTLANTWKQGAVTASPADEDSRKANSSEPRFLDWLQAAEDRGSARAYFIRASLHVTGEADQVKSYALAKQYLDRVKKTEPSLLSKAPGLEARINQLKAENDVESPTTSPTTKKSPTSSGTVATTTTNGNTRAQQAPPSAADRLARLENASRGNVTSNMEVAAPRRAGGGMLSKGGARGAAASAKWKSRIETIAKIGVGCYFTYCLLFPLRIIIAPQAFEIMAYMMDLFGAGAYIQVGRGPAGF